MSIYFCIFEGVYSQWISRSSIVGSCGKCTQNCKHGYISLWVFQPHTPHPLMRVPLGTRCPTGVVAHSDPCASLSGGNLTRVLLSQSQHSDGGRLLLHVTKEHFMPFPVNASCIFLGQFSTRLRSDCDTENWTYCPGTCDEVCTEFW